MSKIIFLITEFDHESQTGNIPSYKKIGRRCRSINSVKGQMKVTISPRGCLPSVRPDGTRYACLFWSEATTGFMSDVFYKIISIDNWGAGRYENVDRKESIACLGDCWSCAQSDIFYELEKKM